MPTPTYNFPIATALERLDRAATMKDTGRHAHYDHTVELASQYTALATTQNYEQFIVMFKRREDPDQLKQRLAITVPKSSALLAPVISQFHRTSRLPNIRRSISYDKKVEDPRLDIVRTTMSEFYGEGGVDEWIATVFDWAAIIDPNSYTVVEFERTESQIKPYPGLYWSPQIYEPGRTHRRQLEYLLVQPDANSTSEYLLYAGQYAMRYTLLPEDAALRQQAVDQAKNKYEADPIFYIRDEADGSNTGPAYLRQLYPTECPFVQAEVMGYIPDPTTNFQTYVSAIEPAKWVLIDHLRTGSNFDLSKYMHVMPQKIVAQTVCKAQGCNKGKLPDGITNCPACHGKGITPMHTQPTDTIEVPMERDPNKMPDLSKLIHYVQVELSTFDSLDKNLEKLANQMWVAIFSNEVVLQQQVTSAPTATAIATQLDNTNNTLTPFGNHKALHWRFLARCIAVLVSSTDFDYTRFAAVYELPKNLKPLTKEEMYIRLKAARDAQAPQSQIEQICKELLEMDFEGDEEGLMKLRVRLSHIPFIGLDWEMIQYLDSRGYIRKRDVVLLAYQDSVFADLERENEKFYELKYTDRDKMIIDYINAVMGDLPQDTLQVNMGKIKPLLGEQEPTAASA